MSFLILKNIFKLNDGVEICPLDANEVKNKYILSIGDRHIQISEVIVNVVELIDGKSTTKEILDKINNEKNQLNNNQIVHIFSNLLIPYGVVVSKNKIIEKPKSHLYLKFRLLPRHFLFPITNILKLLFNKKIFTFLSILIGLFLFNLFMSEPISIIEITNLKGSSLILLFVIIFIGTIFHELGHLSACHHYDVEYKEIGIGFYLYFLVFYSDISVSWKLKKNQRVIVDIGGIYFQIVYSAFIYIIYLFYNNILLVHAIYLILFSILVSLNPFLKFDGYWVTSDLMGIPNLRKRTVSYMKCLIRQFYKENTISCNSSITKKIKSKFILYIILSNLFFVFNIIYLVFIVSFEFNYSEIFKSFIMILNSSTLSEILSGLNEIFLYLLLLFYFSFSFVTITKRSIRYLRKFSSKKIWCHYE